MRKSRFTDAQKIGMIKEQEAGLPTAELCRKRGLSPAAFYELKAKYGRMDLSDAKRLKQPEDENAKLKCLVADVMLDNVVFERSVGKALITSVQRREAVLRVMKGHGLHLAHSIMLLFRGKSTYPGCSEFRNHL